jgi:hypothetical protein
MFASITNDMMTQMSNEKIASVIPDFFDVYQREFFLLFVQLSVNKTQVNDNLYSIPEIRGSQPIGTRVPPNQKQFHLRAPKSFLQPFCIPPNKINLLKYA